MPESLELKLTTLTPFFTGGVDGICDRLHETSLIGSMRWWFEAIVRGFGGYACDPTEHKCKDNDLCAACFVFGATGHKRLFRLKTDLELINDESNNSLKVEAKNSKWYIKRGLFVKNATVKLIYSKQEHLLPSENNDETSIKKVLSSEELKNMLLLTLKIMSINGSFGGGTSYGNGVLNIDCDRVDKNIAIHGFNKLKNHFPVSISSNDSKPKLNDFFFTKIQFKKIQINAVPEKESKWYTDNRIIPISPQMRYYLRSLIREDKNFSKDERHRLMGFVPNNHENEQKFSSLIRISNAYPLNENEYEFRIWGWFPSDFEKKDEILNKYKEWISTLPSQKGGLWEKTNLSPLSSSTLFCDSMEFFIKQLLED
ncbi:type III-B CRISPR module RAMP protein Cmr1 [Methanolapillus ohkumae]|uniref:CRISPR type III-associated protein domain-containing protein n=1 Tax=Methanolapillus ohkumae TaxID=3028298 RepID=A0AA96VGW9_9EURY|nr:hypothetical protein MsAm2_00870 [Methanosarcinaceae archaeon Am2]